MSASPEELDYALLSSVEVMYCDIILTGHMTKDQLLDRIDQLLTERGA